MYFAAQDAWIAPDTMLVGERVRLLPLRYDHLETLIDIGNDPRIWEHFPSDRTQPSAHYRHLCQVLVDMKRGLQHAFVIEHRNSSQIAGMTRLFHLDTDNRQLEMGTWLAPPFWKTGLNTETKFLMLQFCFETLKTVRVQFRTDVNNQRSRRAIEKIGAQFEGIFRNERLRDDGTTRDAAFYSIIDAEWETVSQHLQQRLQGYESPNFSQLPEFQYF